MVQADIGVYRPGGDRGYGPGHIVQPIYTESNPALQLNRIFTKWGGRIKREFPKAYIILYLMRLMSYNKHGLKICLFS